MRAVRRGDKRTLTIQDGTRSKGVRVWGPPVGASFRSVKFSSVEYYICISPYVIQDPILNFNLLMGL